MDRRRTHHALLRWLMRVSPAFDAGREWRMRRNAEAVVAKGVEQRKRFAEVAANYQRTDDALRRR